MELLKSVQNGAVTKKIEDTAFHLEGISAYLPKFCDDSPVELDLNDVIWGDTNYPNLHILPQYETERILEGAFNDDGGHVEYGVSLEDLAQSDDNLVTTTLRNTTDETTETVKSKFVIGADGGRSKTRDLIGIKIDRHQSDAYFIVADIVFKNEPAEFQGKQKNMHLFPSKKGVAVLLPLPKQNAFRLLAHAPLGITSKDELNLDENFFEQLLLERTGIQFEVGLGPWQTIFEMTHGSSESFRIKNVMLAGDASHIHSPVGGQGMNLGIQDAMNLLWKLAWVKRISEATPTEEGQETEEEVASTIETILSSYNSERQSLVQALVKRVEFATKMIATRNPVLQSIRSMAIRIVLSSNIMKNGFRNLGQLEMHFSPESSPIIIENQTKKATFICDPGQRLPNIRLDDDSHLHSHIDRVRYTWLFLNTNTTKSSGSWKVVQAIPAPSDKQVSIPSISEKTLAAQQVLLVRPDQFLAAVGDSQEDILKELKKAGMTEMAIATM
jgi:NADPH-dependent dioxygenase